MLLLEVVVCEDLIYSLDKYIYGIEIIRQECFPLFQT